MKIGVLNGPNLNLLGKREPTVYGKFTLKDIGDKLVAIAPKGVQIIFFQSNIEGELINFIQNAFLKENFDYLIFNPGAFTHSSIALRDAISGVSAKVIEVHISNIYKREAFRHKSFLSPVCIGQIAGFGIQSYILALEYILSVTKNA